MTTAAAVLLLAKITVVTLAGLAAGHAARRSRAAVRHVLLAATLGVAVALPLTSLLAPAIRITVTMPAAAAAIESFTPPPASGARASATASQAAPPAAPAPAGPALSWRSLITMAWLIGAALCLLPLAIGFRQMRALRRCGLPDPHAQSVADAAARDIGMTRRVQVLLHESAAGPLTFGVIRPAIVLPRDAARWSGDDLRRALIHELEHVRRYDWLTQCGARVVCALYWFHPLIWIVWHRFVLEAERACDDAVLGRSDAAAYADQLVDLAKRLSTAARQPLIAMASRADLSTRVAAVLDDRQVRGRAGARSVTAAVLTAIALMLVLSPLRLVAVSQAPQPAGAAGPKLRYDVASIKACEPEEEPASGARGTAGGTNASISPGRFTVPCVTTEQLIYLAYASYGAEEKDRLINDDFGSASSPMKVRGGPDWVHSSKEKYAIEATAAGATERTVLMGAMLRTLLEDRFKLKLHRESEEADMYELSVGKAGLKLPPAKDGDCELATPGIARTTVANRASAPPPPDPNAAKPRCGSVNMQSGSGQHVWVFGGTELSSLATVLSRRIGMRVIDRTGVTDKFVFTLMFRLDDSGAPMGRDASGHAPAAPSLAVALDAVGLKLEKVKAPRGFLVIDHIQRPTPDAPTPTPPMRAAGAGTTHK